MLIFLVVVVIRTDNGDSRGSLSKIGPLQFDPLNTSVSEMVREFLTCLKSSMSSRLRTQLLHHIFKLTVVEDDDLDFFLHL